MRRRIGLGVVATVAAVVAATPPAPAPAPPLVGAVIAHRGGRAHAPDNSLRAIAAAADRGADAVELDVIRAADGRLVCAHDRGALAGAPPLAEALDLARSLGLQVELDLKTGWTGDRALVREVVATIERRDGIWVSAFHPLAAWHVRRADRRLPLGWPMPATGWAAVDALLAWDGPARWLGASLIEPSARLATPARLERWARAGWLVEVYDVPDERVGELRARGVAVVVDRVP